MRSPFLVMSLLAAQPGHGGHGGHGSHGNPGDLEAYIKKMEDPERDAWQKPAEVVKALALKKTDVVCDIGAGPGYFALRIAREAAHVHAIDVEPKMLETLRDRITKSGATNVTPILALPADPLLPGKSCDVILVVDTYHHFPDGVAYLKRLAHSLKPGGRIANIDFHDRDLPVGPKHDKVSREKFLADAKSAGLSLAKEHDFLEHQYFLVFTVTGARR